jgi:hypothetical protein
MKKHQKNPECSYSKFCSFGGKNTKLERNSAGICNLVLMNLMKRRRRRRKKKKRAIRAVW